MHLPAELLAAEINFNFLPDFKTGTGQNQMGHSEGIQDGENNNYQEPPMVATAWLAVAWLAAGDRPRPSP